MNKRSEKNSISKIVLLVIVILFYAFPLWYVLNNVFKQEKYILISPLLINFKMLTLSNIQNALEWLGYFRALLSSIIILSVSCFIMLLTGSLASYAIATVRVKFFNALYVFFVSLITMPFFVAMIPLIRLMKSFNLLDNYLGLGLVYSAIALPIVIFLYTGFMRTVPREIYEAATIDGCGMFKMYLVIYMPLMTTITGIILIVRALGIWNDFMIPLVLTSKPAYHNLMMRLLSAVSEQRASQYGVLFAGTFLVSLPLVIMFLLLQKSFVHGIMAGSIKG